MIKLFSVKDKQQKEAAAASNGKIKQSAGELRLQKDMSELNLSNNMSIHFPDGKDKIMNFVVIISPDEGFYRGGSFEFSFSIPSSYPHEAPKVKCKTKVFHPNIDLEGNICLNILREDWKPVLNINSVIYGLNFLFLDPNPEDPLNKEAAEMFQNNPRSFESMVAKSIMRGAYINGNFFPPCQR
uniref:Ubiquitin-conjugating enzyme E2 M n=1 Tax=Tetraselmis sp. GSL018 TaxID=582737 RepID=A0A061SAD8_9CHLO|mmetsp:Transcript_33949/g.80606  ORF Transcript_33949/g.80606 Transcript_33949/m.80606 type:complete len:184 (+) Transcript_33949:392-943(+)|eukprot:CAMPEP_0177597362 /NCGR_PEP_ID=MMETSP0419_2-20121207/11665_1 /TAXON_ID=582737 /ORGANISM="Tetraselmis sp., Strain GSL018" /LENGTH=183 /DNA_ID=CAMNT_0019089515 /DNA_START=360 /DNA_END=911 /DNA_ORIENTATION=-